MKYLNKEYILEQKPENKYLLLNSLSCLHLNYTIEFYGNAIFLPFVIWFESESNDLLKIDALNGFAGILQKSLTIIERKCPQKPMSFYDRCRHRDFQYSLWPLSADHRLTEELLFKKVSSTKEENFVKTVYGQNLPKYALITILLLISIYI